MHVIMSFDWIFGTVCGWAGAGFMCTLLEMLHALTGASADSNLDVWVAILTDRDARADGHRATRRRSHLRDLVTMCE